MRFGRALALGIAAATFAVVAACSSFGSSTDSTADGTSTPDGAVEGGASLDASTIGPGSDGGTTACAKVAFSDGFTVRPKSNGWEEVGDGSFTILSGAGVPARQAVVGSVDLAMQNQEAYAQRYVTVVAPTSVRLRYGYGVGGNTVGAATVGCRIAFEGPGGSVGASELAFNHHNGSAKVKLANAATEIDTFDYDLGSNVQTVTWHDVDLRVDIVGSTGTVTLAGFDVAALGSLPIPSGLKDLRLRCGAAQLDYSSGQLGVGITNLELDVCP